MNQVSGLYLSISPRKLQRNYGSIVISRTVTKEVPLEIVERILEIHIKTDWNDNKFQRQFDNESRGIGTKDPIIRTRKDGSSYSQDYGTHSKSSCFMGAYKGRAILITTGMGVERATEKVTFYTSVEFLIEEEE